MAVYDPRAIQVVGGQLTANPIARENADPEAPHLARDVPKHDVVVVELDAEHRVRQGLDNLSFELDFLFFGHRQLP